ncbi:4-diphosphocytidyl-2-C-methyl-D-erythritol kinase [Hypnocyclicus thermotrophus]|uniref:4-diphosphocytidyl-2-C-methyl-D-erythritol kinase n=1 Tax=Hypnocyclicus thermotrophus TaxID=1627895 RepID=A0AA46DYN5_9FUSO|nr:4-(cytidine 5'-diphospho)-2-C-methyl-D-erythritol kinase [Hypnocyclicus thermotrophus]TDT69842.1 4-diphosphocytidyl-2-C-methyl-D-erythritol kinase [Hypnocyclicus thermotrophus]
MKSYKEKANAKINIGLNILEKLENGYHSLDMIMAPIDLSDILEIKFNEKKGNLKIFCNKNDVPINENNIIYKIYNKFYEYTSLQREDIEVKLIKRIPSEAGLGGGSSDGATFLKVLNNYNNNILSTNEMINISKDIGADIPFFIINKTTRVKGIGEKLEIIENKLESDIILVKPSFGISTKDAYINYSNLKNKNNANIEKIIKGLKENDVNLVRDNIDNHLQQSAKLFKNELEKFEKELYKLTKLKFYMTGSGSCYYSFVEKKDSKKIINLLKNKYGTYFISLTRFY